MISKVKIYGFDTLRCNTDGREVRDIEVLKVRWVGGGGRGEGGRGRVLLLLCVIESLDNDRV